MARDFPKRLSKAFLDSPFFRMAKERQADKTAPKPTDTVQLRVRVSESLRLRLEYESKQRNRSLNSEIVSRLQQTLLSEASVDAIMASALFEALDKNVQSHLVGLFLSQQDLSEVEQFMPLMQE